MSNDLLLVVYSLVVHIISGEGETWFFASGHYFEFNCFHWLAVDPQHHVVFTLKTLQHSNIKTFHCLCCATLTTVSVPVSALIYYILPLDRRDVPGMWCKRLCQGKNCYMIDFNSCNTSNPYVTSRFGLLVVNIFYIG